MRYVMRKVGLYGSEMVSPQGRYFWTGGLAYDRGALSDVSLQFGVQEYLFVRRIKRKKI